MNLLDLLPQLAQIANLKAQKFVGVPSPAWGALAAARQRDAGNTLLLVAPNTELAERAAHDLHAIFDGEPAAPKVLLFPVPDRMQGDEVGGDSRATQERLAVLDALHGETLVIVVAPVNALAHTTLPPEELRQGYDSIVVGQTLDREEFINHLAETGFERTDEVEAPGQFAARGGLIDFFPPASEYPIRLELFGDEIDSLRTFDLDSQRSIDKLQEFRLTPPREEYLSLKRGREVASQLQEILEQQVVELESAGLGDDAQTLRERAAKDIARLEQATYFPELSRYRALLYPSRPTLFEHLPDDAVVVWADPERAHTQNERLMDDEQANRAEAAASGTQLRLTQTPLCDFETLRARAKKFNNTELYVAEEAGEVTLENQALKIHLPPSFNGNLPTFVKWVKDRQLDNALIVISTSHARRVREILADGKVHHVHLLDAVNEVQPGLALVMPQRLTAGFEIKTKEGATSQQSKTANYAPQPTSLIVLSDAELFGWQANLRLPVKVRKREAKTKYAEKSKALSDLADLKEGDYVVHIQHGIARYAGVTRQEVGGAVSDYLMLEYAGADRLYVPTSQLDRVQKYLGAGATVPSLHNMRGGEWEKAKQRVREEVAKIARQLAELYAAREQADKEPIAPDSPWQREMESAFPYEETPSQLQAIKDVKSDLESNKPMDRLVCGDVGFGKTEVAVRAAFKVLQDGKQVAVLVPTTVLAQQHYQTFSERLAPYPARVDVISRFRTPGELRQILEETKQGGIDVLVGTHRLLQQDVEFPNLGLVIVDEEQRFGVMQKERLKEMRKQVDILTLSATPIPRTMHFALGGLREISLINDPPQGRLPVRTFVAPYRDEMVRQAIERELEREGQAYYVHNRIGSIYHVAEKLRSLIPHARIGIGHGQMSDEELEQVMLDFMHRRTDVLLATTIIENGLDLPNVNTIIVDRAERLGLSQMYQLRGRVGRSSRQAYAYFLMGARGKVGEEAEERFAAIQEYTDLGAGFKIAMRDLEIRGAGDLLGTKQSGSIASVGFEMYADMLSEAVGRLKGIRETKKQELPEADLPVAAFLPDDYVTVDRDRLQLYRKMASVTQLEEVEQIQAELRDRFGALPSQAFNLIRVLRIRVYLLHAQLRGIFKSEQEILIRLKPGDKFHDDDLAAVYAKLREENDARTLQNLSLKAREGLAIDTRVLTPPQLLRMTEQVCESLAITRGARLLGKK
jgi:transcription-repair coupling factor (superfamily II helicase)